jgi:hypothetical protein
MHSLKTENGRISFDNDVVIGPVPRMGHAKQTSQQIDTRGALKYEDVEANNLTYVENIDSFLLPAHTKYLVEAHMEGISSNPGIAHIIDLQYSEDGSDWESFGTQALFRGNSASMSGILNVGHNYLHVRVMVTAANGLINYVSNGGYFIIKSI